MKPHRSTSDSPPPHLLCFWEAACTLSASVAGRAQFPSSTERNGSGPRQRDPPQATTPSSENWSVQEREREREEWASADVSLTVHFRPVRLTAGGENHLSGEWGAFVVAKRQWAKISCNKQHPCVHTMECFKYSALVMLGSIFCVPVCAGNTGRKSRYGARAPKKCSPFPADPRCIHRGVDRWEPGAGSVSLWTGRPGLGASPRSPAHDTCLWMPAEPSQDGAKVTVGQQDRLTLRILPA